MSLWALVMALLAAPAVEQVMVQEVAVATEQVMVVVYLLLRLGLSLQCSPNIPALPVVPVLRVLWA